MTLSVALGGPGRARQVFRALAAGLDPYEPGVLPAGLADRLRSVTRPGAHSTVDRRVAADGTTKVLLCLEDGAQIETVLIPENGPGNRATLCVSSQVGCARGCRFCVTATMGLVRNLDPAEIVAQVVHGLREARSAGWSLRNLVFMGMGEPLDNREHVLAALDVLVDGRGLGFAPRHITLSTVGPRLGAIRQLRGWPVRVAWSLHAATEETRRVLVPGPQPSLADLTAAFAEICAADRRPLFVEMTLMDGINDADFDMNAAADLFDGFPTEVRFNLIAMNPGRDGLRPSPRAEACRARLWARGYFCSIRQPRGRDADAACGQLATRLDPRLIRPGGCRPA